MSAECDDGTIVWVGHIVLFVVIGKSVVKVGGVLVQIHPVEFTRGHHLSQIPQFHHLVFAIGEDVAAVTFGVDVSDTFGVSDEDTCFTSIGHGSAIPYS